MRSVLVPCIACCAMLLDVGNARAAAEDPRRAPTGQVTNPRDLLKEPDGLELRFGYFPSADQLRLLVLGPREGFMRWEARLSRLSSDEPLSRWEGTLPFPRAGATLDAPALSEGTYALAVSLLSNDGRRREFHRTFENRRFPWADNPAGRDRVVVPPFTPMQTDEEQRIIDCVLRRHELAATELWNQVLSQQRPLLASPMRLEIESAGKMHIAQGNRLDFSEKATDHVRERAAWAAGRRSSTVWSPVASSAASIRSPTCVTS